MSVDFVSLMHRMRPLFSTRRMKRRHARLERRSGPTGGASRFRVEPLEPRLLLAADISAVMTDALATDLDGDAVADPGDTVQYAVELANTGDTDAADVLFADTLDANTTLVPGSLNVSPLAMDDFYAAVGNTLLEVGVTPSGLPAVQVSGSLFNNDVEFLGDAFSLAGFDATSASGGTVSVNTDGTFTYLPAAGFDGMDTFTYTLVDSGGLTGDATVTIEVSDPVWYVDNTAAAGGDGRSDSPFTSLAPLNGPGDPDDANDIVFIFQGVGYTAGGIQLENGQQLIGQGVDLVVGGQTLVAAAGRPTITNSGVGNAVNLASDNILRGLNVTATDGRGVSGTGIGSLTLDQVSVNTVNGGGVLLTNGGALAVTFDSITVTGSGGDHGIFLQNNGGTTAFVGGLSLTTGDSPAFTASSGGTVTVTQDNTSIVNTLSTSTGTALNVSNTTIGGGGLTFRSVSAGTGTDSPGSGIILENTGNLGGLTVTGVGTTTGSGGTIQHKTGADGTAGGTGIWLNGTREVSLSNLLLHDFSNYAVRGTNVTNFTLANSTVNGANGTSASADEGSLRFDNLLGDATISDSTISGGLEDNLLVINTTGILDRLTVSGTTIGLNDEVLGNDGILVEAQNTAVVMLTVTGSTFLGARGDLIQANAIGTSTLDVLIQDNSFDNVHPNTVSGGGGVTISGGSAGGNVSVSYEISASPAGSQTFSGAVGNAITANFIGGAGAVTGTIANNAIGIAGLAGSGSTQGSGISVGAAGTVTHTVTIDSNLVQEVKGFGGIDLVANSDANFNATITNNSVTLSSDPSDNFGLAALTAVVGGGGFETGTANLDLHDNVFDASGAEFGIAAAFFDQISPAAHYNLPGYTGSPNGEFAAPPGTASGDIAAYLTGRGNTLVDPPFPTFPGADASLVAGVTGNAFLLAAATPPGSGPAQNEEVSVADGPAEEQGEPTAPGGDPLEDPLAPVGTLTAEALSGVFAGAIDRWAATGLSDAQRLALDAVSVQVADVAGWALGATTGTAITLDSDAAGWGWFVDATPLDDAEFASTASPTRLTADETSGAYGRMDLLTAVMHEVGHVLGLTDASPISQGDKLMAGTLMPGQRLLPAAGDAAEAVAGSLVSTALIGAPISIGTLPAGKSVMITFQATINGPGVFPTTVTQVSNQGVVSGGNFTDVLTDDPDTAAPNDPTLTAVPQADLTVIKSESVDPVSPGGAFAYLVSITNNGPSEAVGVVVTDTLPTGVTYVSDDQGAGPPVGQELTLSVPSLAAGSTLLWTINVLAPGSAGGSLQNEATVTSTTHDFDAGNNAATESTALFEPMTISGLKFRDLDGDGVRDAGEPGVQGWTIQLDAGADGSVDATAVTDADGLYSFAGLGAGTYRVREVLQAGWVQTTADPADIVAVSGVDVDGVDFGNFARISINGQKFHDANADGVKDGSEPGLPNWTIQLDAGADGSVDATTTTDANGAYSFAGLGPGVYRVREVLQAGWVQTTANPDDVVATSGVAVIGVDFGNVLGAAIHGVKFEDFNGDGVRNTDIIRGDEPDVVFVIDVSGSTQNPFSGRPVGDLNSDGRPNTILDAEIAAFIALNQRLIDLGLGNDADVAVVSFEDLAVILDMDPVAAGIQVATHPLADADNNGVLDVVQALTALDYLQATNYTDALQKTIDVLNTLGTVKEDGNVIFLSDGRPSAGGSYLPVLATLRTKADNLRAFGVGTNANLGELRRIDPTARIFTTTDQLIDTLSGTGPVTVFSEPGLNGWEIQLVDQGTGQVVATQVTQDIDLDGNGLIDPFAERGWYRFEGVRPGQYEVREVPQAGWLQTEPAGGFHSVAVGPGEKVAGLDFGNFQLGAIHGIKFEDLNGNGVNDGEPGLAGVTIELDGDGDGLAEYSTVTDANGEYAFETVVPGLYTLTETVPDGFVRTTDPVSPLVVVSGEVQVAFAGQTGSPDEVVNVELAIGNAVPGSIHGFKFEDVDADGVFDAGVDLPVASVEFTLSGTDGRGQAVSLTTVTDANGAFWFLDLRPGTYTVTETVPAGHVATTPTTFTHELRSRQELVAFAGQAMLPPDALQAEVLIGAPLQFGNTVPGSIHGFKFEDVDADGAYDPSVDAALPNVGFRLTGTDGHGQGVSLTTVTDANGEFRFADLLPGAYTVTETVPVGHVATTATTFAHELRSRQELVAFPGQASLPPDALQAEVLIGAPLQFGNTVPGSIHGFKFEDVDADGVYEAGTDRPFAGVTFSLTGTDGQGNTVSLTTLTDADGEFSFDGLLAGIYTVAETVPPEAIPTTPTSVTLEVLSRQELVALAGQASLPPGDPQVEVVLGTTLFFGNTITPTVEFSKASYQVNEDGTPVGMAVTLTRTGNLTLGSDIGVAFTGGTAMGGPGGGPGTDYDNDALVITFAPNEASHTVVVPITQDAIVELNETITLAITSLANAIIGAKDTAELVILNDDAATLAIGDVTRAEGDSGLTAFTFTVTLDAAVDTALTVDFATADGTATVADNDYVPASGSGVTALTFAGMAGETHTITVQVTGDTMLERHETFVVNLSNLQAGGRAVTLADDQGAGTIVNDDSGAVIIDRTLLIVGTGCDDYVKVDRKGKDVIKVKANFLPDRGHSRLFNGSDFDRIEIQLLDGNDKAQVDKKIDVPVLIDGGAGHDKLMAGGGPAVLLGGAGNDWLFGGRKNDLLLGGDGHDRLFGSFGDDVLKGEAGDDVLFGGLGNDLLDGGPGRDRLYGGPGCDELIRDAEDRGPRVDWDRHDPPRHRFTHHPLTMHKPWVNSFVSNQGHASENLHGHHALSVKLPHAKR